MLTPFGSRPNPAELMMLALRWKGNFGEQVAVKRLYLPAERCNAQSTEAQTGEDQEVLEFWTISSMKVLYQMTSNRASYSGL